MVDSGENNGCSETGIIGKGWREVLEGQEAMNSVE